MEIKVAKTAGFCFGVKRAVDLVYKEANNKCCEKIYTYGPIIHNEEVMKDMKSKGIERKGRLQFVEKNKSQTKTLILELTPDIEEELRGYISDIESLIEQEVIPQPSDKAQCKKCSYYEYCYI